MKVIDTYSDISSLAIDCGNGNVIAYPKQNGEDGNTYAIIFDNYEELENYCKNRNIDYEYKSNYLGTARFNNAHILIDDCDGIDNNHPIAENHRLYALNGRYSIRAFDDMFLITKWED